MDVGLRALRKMALKYKEHMAILAQCFADTVCGNLQHAVISLNVTILTFTGQNCYSPSPTRWHSATLNSLINSHLSQDVTSVVTSKEQ